MMRGAFLPRLDRAPGRGQVAVVGALAALAAAAWVGTWASAGMADMDVLGTGAGALAVFIATWVLMMAAMMLPSISPLVLTYRLLVRARRARGQRSPTAATALLVGGYLLVWTATGLLGYAVFRGAASLAPASLAWDRGGPYLAGAVIVAAAAYQFTPLKHACLTRCRGPLGFFLEHWREGPVGAVRMGALHGAYCVGCCWALMGVLFALGAMSVTWMAMVAALIASEKLLPWRRFATAAVAAVLLVLGLSVAAAPDRLPGLDPSGGGMSMSGRE
jgi:predicted metal-binding membrane protein